MYQYWVLQSIGTATGWLGVQDLELGLIWNFTEVKQDEKRFWMLASVHALCLPSVEVHVFQTWVWGWGLGLGKRESKSKSARYKETELE